MITNNDFITQRRSAILLTMLIIVLGTLLYFGTGAYKNSGMSSSSIITKDVLKLLQNVELKAAYTKEGTIDIFALAKEDNLAKLKASQGISVPQVQEMVLGNVEGSMMKKEGEFQNIGDNIEDYTLQFKITGVLAKTNTFADDFHFVNQEQYNLLNGEENKLLIKFKDAKTPKLFYLYDINNSAVKIELAEGNIGYYNVQILNNKIYYPLILGYDEAKMMREEKLFTHIGDKLDGFFGKDVIIVGIIQKNNNSMDMMHIVQSDFFELNTRKLLV